MNQQKINRIFFGGCLLWLAIYVVFALSPSSYGVALDLFGVENPGLFKERPIRSDEWAVWTPYTQMAVYNHFERFYDMSAYQIDLRNFNQLPLWDWALPFKPLTWGYFFLPPAYAFSLFYASMTVLFLIGWKKVIELLLPEQTESRSLIAIVFAVLVYFCGYVQYWWTTTGPLLAFTPWLILALLYQGRFRYFVVFYAALAWLLSHTYPPIIITMTYVMVAIIVIMTKNVNR